MMIYYSIPSVKHDAKFYAFHKDLLYRSRREMYNKRDRNGHDLNAGKG